MEKFKHSLLLLVSVFCFVSCSTDDYEFDTSANVGTPVTRAAENPMQLKMHLCVSYDPSITDYNRFVIFKNITMRPSIDPDFGYTESVSYYANGNQCVGSVAWQSSYYVTFNVDLYDVIVGEYWLVDVECRANQGYYVNGNYKVSLYVYDGDTPHFVDSHVCVNAQGGDDFTLSTGNSYFYALACTYLGENEYYLSLHVEPVD